MATAKKNPTADTSEPAAAVTHPVVVASGIQVSITNMVIVLVFCISATISAIVYLHTGFASAAELQKHIDRSSDQTERIRDLENRVERLTVLIEHGHPRGAE